MDITGWKRVVMSVKHYQIVTFDIFAGEPGFEPRLKVLETSVLPLYYSPVDRKWVSETDTHFLIDC